MKKSNRQNRKPLITSVEKKAEHQQDMQDYFAKLTDMQLISKIQAQRQSIKKFPKCKWMEDILQIALDEKTKRKLTTRRDRE